MKAPEYAKALYEAIIEVTPESQDKVLDNFTKVLAQNGDLGLMDEIEKEFTKLQRQAQGIKQVQVTTAHESESKGLLKDLHEIVGSKIDVEHKVDPEILGGIVIRVDDTLIDASIKNNLNNLRKHIEK